MKKWWKYKTERLNESLKEQGYRLQTGKGGVGRLVKEQNAREGKN